METLFVTDLDGTLLTKEGRVSVYSCEKINQLIEAGVNFTFATARSVVSARNAVRGLDLRIPAVLYNGGLIYDLSRREVLRAVLFRGEEKSDVYGVLRSFGLCPFVYTARPGEERLKWLSGEVSAGMERYLVRRQGEPRMDPVQTEGELLDDEVFYFRCIGSREALEPAWDALKYDPRFICLFHQEMYQSDFWLEISPHEANKASGVRFLKEYLGSARVVCFGDTANDSDMFDVCDEKYAVMNADAWLKEKATGVVGYCEEDGVAKWLQENALRMS